MRRKLRSQLGQTSMEYMLLLLVSAGIGMTFFKKVDDFLLNNPNSIFNKQINDFKAIMGQDPKFQRYFLIR